MDTKKRLLAGRIADFMTEWDYYNSLDYAEYDAWTESYEQALDLLENGGWASICWYLLSFMDDENSETFHQAKELSNRIYKMALIDKAL